MSGKTGKILAEMTVLDVVSTFRGIEQAFAKYDQQAGTCICCQALFDPLEEVAEKFDLDLDGMIGDLEAAASEIEVQGKNHEAR